MSSRGKSVDGKPSKLIVLEIMDLVLEEIEKDSKKIGVLLCEGDENSIDKVVYSAVFPDLIIIPLQSCTTVMRTLIKVRQYLAPYELYAFGIIDRDALSKTEKKKLLKEKQIHTTKLPFIENIICAPEVIELLCENLGLDYKVTIEKIQEQLIKILWQRFKEALPINLGIEKDERIDFLRIGASTKYKNIEKTVDRENILYAYRSKVIVSVVASAMRIDGKKSYYEKVKQLFSDEKYSERLTKIISRFVPKFELYNFNDI